MATLNSRSYERVPIIDHRNLTAEEAFPLRSGLLQYIENPRSAWTAALPYALANPAKDGQHARPATYGPALSPFDPSAVLFDAACKHARDETDQRDLVERETEIAPQAGQRNSLASTSLDGKRKDGASSGLPRRLADGERLVELLVRVDRAWRGGGDTGVATWPLDMRG